MDCHELRLRSHPCPLLHSDMAPEVWKMFVSPRESYDGRACDIYSLGILLWRIHSNAFPEVIQSGGDGEVVIPQVSLTGSARDLIAGMIKVTFCAAAVILRSCQRAVLQSRWSGWILLPVSTTLFACQPSGTYCMPYGHDLAIYSTLISSYSIMIRNSLKVNLDPHNHTSGGPETTSAMARYLEARFPLEHE